MRTRSAEVFALTNGHEYMFPDDSVMVYEHPAKNCPTRFKIKRRCISVTGWYNSMITVTIEYRDGSIYILGENISNIWFEPEDHRCVTGVEHFSYDPAEIEQFVGRILKESSFVEFLKTQKEKLDKSDEDTRTLFNCYQDMIDIVTKKPEKVKLDSAFRKTITELPKRNRWRH